MKRGQLVRCKGLLLKSILLGVGFVALQCKVWVDLWTSGLHLDSGAYGGTFYVLTAFHALHVLVGLGLLSWLVAPLFGPAPSAPCRVRATLTAMFWHFASAAWLAVFVAIYVL